MLFDLFALVDFSDETKTTFNPFAEQETYKGLKYHEQLKESTHTHIRSLYKHEADALSFYDDRNVEVYIYGYCFPRSDSKFFEEHKRLTAAQVAFAYGKLQQHFLKEIKGSFSLLIYDKERQQVQLFTDPLNVRPMYYHAHGSKLAVSTSLSALVQFMQETGQEVAVDEASVMEYYLFEYVLNDQTYVRSVSSMPAGGWLSFIEDGLEVRQYWDPFEDLNKFEIRYNEEEAIEKLEAVLKHNIDLYLSGNRPTAVALTGGYDSRTNLALLGDRAKDFLFYSYGVEDTYDLGIPLEIAKKLNLKFKPIYLSRRYQESYSENARQAIGMGDGIAEASRANYLYAFKELGKEYDSILTGLFGSELIKHPTSVGNFIDQNSKRLLNSDKPGEVLEEILKESQAEGYIQPAMLRENRQELEGRVMGNPYINFKNKDTSLAQKYFYFLLMVGVRKYFMKEMKVERPYVENLHPFLDIEFVETLLQTPFPWVYHWTGKKNLVKSIQTHRLYVSLIHKNEPRLSNILSTHAYKPRYLLNKATLPLMALQYWYYKDKISSKGSFRSLKPIWKYFGDNPVNGRYECFFNNRQLQAVRESDSKNTIKLSSLQHWMTANQVKP
jgi:asparagine synthetase B (glutamine-hydrolysing)